MNPLKKQNDDLSKPVTDTQPPTPDSKVNTIPMEALKTSEQSKLTTTPRSKDPFNEDKVSSKVPSIEAVQGTPPDDTVKGG